MIKKLLYAGAVVILLAGCSAKKNSAPYKPVTGTGIMLNHAKQFTAERTDDGCTLVDINGDRYMIVPDGTEPPADTLGAVIIQQPVSCVYNAASSAMDLIDGAGALDRVAMTSTKYEDWCLDSVTSAMDRGDITYIGKYSAPDYEALLENGCGLVIESTMIYHSPEVREQIEALGIPVLVERSSYETDPLGRMEWIKLYGIIFGCEEQANRLYEEKTGQLNSILTDENSGQKAAFFYINSTGGVVIRKPSDYVPEMMRMAGGEYIFSADDLGTDENALSTMTIQPEIFYEKAWNADVLIYNSDITGGIDSLSSLLEKYPVLGDFTAIQNGNIWCTERNMFQQTTGAAEMIEELHRIFTGEADDRMEFIYRLEG